MIDRDMFNDLVDGLCRIFDGNIRQIILYGSVARNEATPESDIDIAIILKNGMKDDDRASFISFAADLDLKYERIFSIVDIEQQNMEKWGMILPFYKNIQRDGVVLWAAA